MSTSRPPSGPPPGLPMILASRSPRRADLMRRCGYRFVTRPARTDESLRPGESGVVAARRLAIEKALDVAARTPRGTIVAADTLVLNNGSALGKPSSRAEAARMLRSLSGRTHRVVTGIAVCGPGGRGLVWGRSVTRVTFRPMEENEIAWYVATGEPMDKAGAYAIQGAAGLFVTSIRGSLSNVIGLPLELLHRLAGPPPHPQHARGRRTTRRSP